MKSDPKQPEEEDLHEKRVRQLLLIDRLARRLPWITLAISIIAFIVIFLEILLS